MSLADDIASELITEFSPWVPILGPTEGVEVERIIRSRAEMLAASLDGEPREAAQAAIDLMAVLDRPSEWLLLTPLGQRIVETTLSSQTVGATEAARLLGVSNARVYQLLDEAKLERGPGGITLGSILARRRR